MQGAGYLYFCIPVKPCWRFCLFLYSFTFMSAHALPSTFKGLRPAVQPLGRIAAFTVVCLYGFTVLGFYTLPAVCRFVNLCSLSVSFLQIFPVTRVLVQRQNKESMHGFLPWKIGYHWRSVALFGTASYSNIHLPAPLLCNGLRPKGFMENRIDIWMELGTAPGCALPVIWNPSEWRIFCSPEQSKLCFELLKILSAAQNNLPLQGAGSNLRSRLLIRLEMDFYGREE